MLAFASALAGVVRGFSGFGTALIFLPLAGLVIPPIWAISAVAIMGVTAPVVKVPEMVRQTKKKDLAMLGLGLLVGTPIGLILLLQMATETFRYGVSIFTLLLLAALISGLRYGGTLNRAMLAGCGALGGFMNGALGLPGPPVILLYLSSSMGIAATRATIFIFLILADFLTLFIYGSQGLLSLAQLTIGVLLVLPYFAGIWVGTVIFDPEQEKLYRAIAYVIIGCSAVLGLPLWESMV